MKISIGMMDLSQERFAKHNASQDFGHQSSLLDGLRPSVHVQMEWPCCLTPKPCTRQVRPAIAADHMSVLRAQAWASASGGISAQRPFISASASASGDTSKLPWMLRLFEVSRR